jgi:hypothetical protein
MYILFVALDNAEFGASEIEISSIPGRGILFLVPFFSFFFFRYLL